jgi:hypothetical protein
MGNRGWMMKSRRPERKRQDGVILKLDFEKNV